MRPAEPTSWPRVLMTTDTVGGVFWYSVSLARELCSRGARIALCTMGAPLAPDQRAELLAIPDLEVHESAFALEWMDDPWAEVEAAGRWLLRIADQFQPEVVHVNGYSHAVLPWPAPVLVIAHSCVLSWWQAVRGEPAPARYDEYRRRVREGLARASLVVAPSHSMLESLREHHRFLGPGRVIANGADPARFRPEIKEAFFLAAGRLWDEAKNLGGLSRVAGALPWPVMVAGQPPARNGAVKGLQLVGRVPSTELADLMSRAAVFLHPARYEPFGLVALEAALSGCALVLGDIQSLREIWGDAAVFVPPADPARLASTAARLARSPQLCARLAARARRRAQRYDMKSMADAYLQAYRGLGEPAESQRSNRTNNVVSHPLGL